MTMTLRRFLLLPAGSPRGSSAAPERILAADVDAASLHRAIRRVAAEWPERVVAGEWLHPWLGWTRWLWVGGERG